MTNVAIVLVILAGSCMAGAIVASLCMSAWLSRHGVEANRGLLRARIPRCVQRYREMTREIEGRTGPLLPWFVVPIHLALLFAVAALVAVAAAG